MNARHLLGSIVFVTLGSTAVGCGSTDDGGGGEVTDSGVHPDSHAGDTTTDAPKDSSGFDIGGDTAPDATTDSGKTDSGVDAHDSAVDSTADSAADTATDSTSTDSSTTDSSTTDTTIDDTATADTTVDDTAVADTTVDDTATTDADDGATDATGDVTDAADAGSGLPAQIVWVVRVGDGTSTLTSASAPVFIDKIRLSDGTVTGTLTLPSAFPDAGTVTPLTLAGTGSTEGQLTVSRNGKFVSLAGYATGVGTAAVKGTSTSTVPRVAALINAAETIDTTTTTTSNSGDTIRAAVSDDGTQIWWAGAASGVFYSTLGASGAATIISTGLSNARTVEILGADLYGTAGSGTFRQFDFGGIPTTATAPTDLPGTPTATSSPYGMIGLALHGAAIDTLYVCDDRSTASGGGVQRWTLSGGTWSLSTTFTDTTCHSLTAFSDGTNVYVVVTTLDNPAKLAVYVDTVAGLTTATAITVATSSTTTSTAYFRGVSLPPSP